MRRIAGALCAVWALAGCFGSGDLDFEGSAGGADGGAGDGGAGADGAVADAGPGADGAAADVVGDVAADAGDAGADAAADTGPADAGGADAEPDVAVVDAGPNGGAPDAADAGDVVPPEDTGPDVACTPAVPYADVEAVWNQRCKTCHVSAALGKLSLGKGQGELVNVPSMQLPSMDRIEPGDPANSYLWLKVTDQHKQAGGSGAAMPNGSYPMPQADLDLIEAWILGLENPCP